MTVSHVMMTMSYHQAIAEKYVEMARITMNTHAMMVILLVVMGKLHSQITSIGVVANAR